jgi:hypothetical protein
VDLEAFDAEVGEGVGESVETMLKNDSGAGLLLCNLAVDTAVGQVTLETYGMLVGPATERQEEDPPSALVSPGVIRIIGPP